MLRKRLLQKMKIYCHLIPDNQLRERWRGRFEQMKRRCHDPKCKDFPAYGALGIAVYEPWRLDIREFMEWLVKQPGWDNPQLQLDRKNNKKGYTPGNLRFVTRSVNCNNRKSRVGIFYFNRRWSAQEFRERFCPTWNPGTVHNHMKRGHDATYMAKLYLSTRGQTPLEETL
jgi:hypothetical protein